MKNLKVMVMTLVMCLVTATSFGQMLIDSFYNDKNQYLIYSVVEEFDSMSQEQLSIKVKNWAGTKFNNMNEVLVSETKEQLVFNYITKSFYIKSLGMITTYGWYIRMVVQVKDNKIKISLFDDGNSYWAGSYAGGYSYPSTSARRYKFYDYFTKDDTCRKMYNNGMENTRQNCLSIANDLALSIRTKNIKTLSDNW
jgi:hypothetical protein